MREDLGLIHIYTGDGKGKTTAAVGSAVRAASAGLKVLFLQLLKDGSSSENKALNQLEGITIKVQNNITKFSWLMTPEEKQLCREENNIFLQKEFLNVEKYDLIIVDEFFGSISAGLLQEDLALALIKNKPKNTEIILTGRNPSESFITIADYLSEIKMIKHPFEKGIAAREGIEK